MKKRTARATKKNEGKEVKKLKSEKKEKNAKKLSEKTVKNEKKKTRRRLLGRNEPDESGSVKKRKVEVGSRVVVYFEDRKKHNFIGTVEKELGNSIYEVKWDDGRATQHEEVQLLEKHRNNDESDLDRWNFV